MVKGDMTLEELAFEADQLKAAAGEAVDPAAKTSVLVANITTCNVLQLVFQ